MAALTHARRRPTADRALLGPVPGAVVGEGERGNCGDTEVTVENRTVTLSGAVSRG